MSDLLVTEIGCLVTNEPAFDGTQLGIISDAAIAVTDGKISWVGSRSEEKVSDFQNVVSAKGKTVILRNLIFFVLYFFHVFYD